MISITPSETVAPTSMLRNRNEVLKYLLPKIFGIISEKGQRLEAYPGCSASLDVRTHIVRLSLGCGSHCVERVLAAEISDDESVFRPSDEFTELWRSELLPCRINELASGSVGGCSHGSRSNAIVSFRDVSAGRSSAISFFTDTARARA